VKGLCAVAFAWAALVVQAQEPQTTFRSSSDAVTVDVSVFDGQRAIPGLTVADFDVRDNGVRQTLASVRLNTLPIDVRLLFDTSGSITAEDLERYRRAMARVAEALRPDDRVEILTFSGRISEVVPLQHPPITVVTKRQDRDGTSFFDAVSLAMVTRPLVERRQITVVLTDAQDNDSFFDKDTLYDSARRTSAVVYGVLPTGLAEDVSRFAARLEMVARVTGGRLVRSKWDARMGDLLIRTLAEFRQGYVLNYSLPGNPEPGWHKLTVTVPRAKYNIRAREGYFAR
jgi:VWFA-related protein